MTNSSKDICTKCVLISYIAFAKERDIVLTFFLPKKCDKLFLDRTAIDSLKKMEETKRNTYNIKGGTMICKYILFMKFTNVEGCNKRGGWSNFKRKINVEG